jgi:hypothetical protein
MNLEDAPLYYLRASPIVRKELKTKKIVLFATIGTACSLVCQLFWLAFDILAQRQLKGVWEVLPRASNIVALLSGVSIFAFFLALFVRQK